MSRRERIARERAAREETAGQSQSAPSTSSAPRPVIRAAERNMPYQTQEAWGPETHPMQTVGGSHAGSAASSPQTAPHTAQQQLTDPRAAVAATFAQPITTLPEDQDESAQNSPGQAGRNQSKRHQHQKPSHAEREPLGPVRATVRGFGELCITAGLVLILFVVWQLWWTDIEANEDNAYLADQLTSEWAENPRNELPPDPETPFVAEPVDMNTAFGIMYIPRFGDDYYRTIAEGVSMEPVLNRMGLGRYPNAAMPGEIGNFALAGHRVTYGKPLNLIAELRPGDEIIVQTADGYYTYTFRNFDIVLPDATEVIAPVPSMPEFKGKDRILTLTACNPMFSARERYVAYAELTGWQPAAEGAPDSIRDSAGFQTATGGDQ